MEILFDPDLVFCGSLVPAKSEPRFTVHLAGTPPAILRLRIPAGRKMKARLESMMTLAFQAILQHQRALPMVQEEPSLVNQGSGKPLVSAMFCRQIGVMRSAPPAQRPGVVGWNQPKRLLGNRIDLLPIYFDRVVGAGGAEPVSQAQAGGVGSGTPIREDLPPEGVQLESE